MLEATIEALNILTTIQRESMCDRPPQDEVDLTRSRILTSARLYLYRSLQSYLTGGPDEIQSVDL